ncbi:winged helix-turn-helix transcriptional regulator [Pseudonocardia acaciae]|uniref:winged helix-turn-helix transcriptional regulator n=1 Tax=Pseudonocardia acaciae TaxID=551276 RepID=UPI000A9E5C7C|nr:helix-turn-helix domain-containing protein [Pseudonocardia acaciae]
MSQPYDRGESFCPSYHHAVELIGRRWSGVILRELLLGASRYGQLRSAIPELTDKMLTNRLRELESEGLVTRTVIDASPVRVEYALTKKGKDLENAITALSEWADRWFPAGDDAPPPDPGR